MGVDSCRVCDGCGQSMADQEIGQASRALRALGHYVHYEDGESARDAVLSVLVRLKLGGVVQAVSFCPNCIVQGLLGCQVSFA